MKIIDKVLEREKELKIVLVFLLFFPFIYKMWLPSGNSIYFLDAIKNKWKLLSFIVVVLLFIKKRKRPSNLFIILLIGELITIVITLINNISGIKETILFTIATLFMALLIEYYVDDINTLINGLLLDFELFLYLNFITVILYCDTNGYLERHYLLGYYNTLIVFTYPAIALAILNIVLNKKYKRSSILIVVSILTIIMSGGSTPLGSLMASVLAILLGTVIYKKNIKIKNYGLLLFVIAFLFCLFILFVFVGGKYKILDFIIEDILHRSTNFTNRLPIWEAAEKMFINNPLGYGRETLIEAIPGWFLIHAHNEYLNILVFSGILGFIVFVIFNIELLNKVDKSSNTFIKYILIGLIFGIYISYVTECYQKEWFFNIIFFLSYHIDEIQNNVKSNKYEQS